MKTIVLSLLAALFISPLAMADGIVCRSQDVLGSFETQYRPQAVELAGTTAFVLDSFNLHVVDISDPLAPSVIGSTAISGINIDMKLLGSTVYIANRNTGLIIVDVSSLTNPTVIGSLDQLGRAMHIDVVGTKAYLANDTSELHIVDVSTPSAPTLLGTYTSIGTNRGVAVAGSMAYLASTDIHIIDISDPAQPVLLGLYDTVGTALDIAAVGTTALIAEGTDGLSIVDMSDASSPTLLSTYPTDGIVRKISLDGSTAYAIESTKGLTGIDISDLTSPSFIGNVHLPSWLDFVTVNNGLAALAGGFDGQMQLVDVSGLTTHDAPVVSLTPTLDYAVNIATEGNYAYVADRQTGLLVYDITTPLSPILISTTGLEGTAGDIVVQDSVAYICGGTSGLHILDVSTPSAPFLIGHNDNPDFSEIVIEGNYIYARGFRKIGVLDVSDPTNPVLQGTHLTDEYTSKIVVRNSIIYIASGYTTLAIFDATDPKSIQHRESVFLNTYPEFTAGIAMMGDTLFVNTDYSLLRVFDVSTASPSLLATYQLSFNTGEMAVVGTDLVMIASGIQVYDASNLLDLQLKGSHALFGSKLTLNGSHAFVAAGTRGFYVADMSDCDDCTADLTGDGTLDFFDVSAFLGAFAAQEAVADFNNDGAWNFFDVSAFLAAFAAGCP